MSWAKKEAQLCTGGLGKAPEEAYFSSGLDAFGPGPFPVAEREKEGERRRREVGREKARWSGVRRKRKERRGAEEAKLSPRARVDDEMMAFGSLLLSPPPPPPPPPSLPLPARPSAASYLVAVRRRRPPEPRCRSQEMASSGGGGSSGGLGSEGESAAASAIGSLDLDGAAASSDNRPGELLAKMYWNCVSNSVRVCNSARVGV